LQVDGEILVAHPGVPRKMQNPPTALRALQALNTFFSLCQLFVDRRKVMHWCR
jgi:hypothetical protein